MKWYISYWSRGIILLLLSITIFGGCTKEEKEEKIPFHIEVQEYKDENIISYAIGDEGEVYITGLTEEKTYLHKYDREGNLVYNYILESVYMSYGLAVNNNTVYIAGNGYNEEGECVVLYSFNMETEVITKLWDFNYLRVPKQLIYYDNKLYLLGSLSNSTGSTLEGLNKPYENNGERLVCYSLEESLTYELGIQIPISMSLTDKDTLMVYAYLESEGYCMVEYNPEKDTALVTAKFDQNRFDQFASANGGKSIIFTSMVNSRGLVLSNLDEILHEAELYEDAYEFGSDIYAIDGYVYFMNMERNLLRLTLASVQRPNTVIRYITPGYQANAPYGCGYMMERSELDYDKFILKILAQDPDYDLSLINSSYHSSYNLKQNGTFYPLNSVEGIEEYLDSCFPYVKEAAINEDGDIWMLPIAIDIPSLIVNEDMIRDKNIPFKNNMSYEEFLQGLNIITKEDYDKLNLHFYSFQWAFFDQYFHQFKTFDSDLFRNKINLLKKYYDKIPEEIEHINYRFTEDFYIVRERYQVSYESVLKYISENKLIKAYSMPKFEEESKNIGTVIFLTVNPNSDRLKDTLNYLSDWINYTMIAEEAPLYFSQPVPEVGTFRHSVYELYKNSDITFSLDKDLYMEGFDEVIELDKDIEEYISISDKKLDVYFNE